MQKSAAQVFLTPDSKKEGRMLPDPCHPLQHLQHLANHFQVPNDNKTYCVADILKNSHTERHTNKNKRHSQVGSSNTHTHHTHIHSITNTLQALRHKHTHRHASYTSKHRHTHRDTAATRAHAAYKKTYLSRHLRLRNPFHIPNPLSFNPCQMFVLFHS